MDSYIVKDNLWVVKEFMEGIVNFMDSYLVNGDRRVAMEFMEGGSLTDVVRYSMMIDHRRDMEMPTTTTFSATQHPFFVTHCSMLSPIRHFRQIFEAMAERKKKKKKKKKKKELLQLRCCKCWSISRRCFHNVSVDSEQHDRQVKSKYTEYCVLCTGADCGGGQRRVIYDCVDTARMLLVRERSDAAFTGNTGRQGIRDPGET
ncbi:Pkinase-domain-containing protein [Venturia nashicola]|uniref:Pkinase-domain-containing protein n=1 Tax=Venturia nashicola TaxID=86259 RepID=A0A4Z1PN37_9PEZI|nr:Pkinase-domain-containing protein [Venturia nashicola]